jgi:carbon storage regulator CsrA
MEVFVMLVLTRKCRQSVVVGCSNSIAPLLTVTVLEIKGANVKLGFKAESNVLVHRWEVWERIGANGPPENPTCDPVVPVS